MKTAATRGFLLLEVVVAIGVLALAVIAIFGVVTATTRSGGEIADAQAAARLGEHVQGELERLRSELGLDGLAAAVPPAGSAGPLQLVATRDGGRVLRADGPAAAADRSLGDPALPGIARRDRYFLIEVTRQLDLPYAPGAGFLAISAIVTWPYHLPTGPPTPQAAAVDADGAREVPREERVWLVLNFALPP